jgi:C4-dicarboxylate transporter DctM subunit
MFPAMLTAGYRENFSLGLITTAGSLGCLIPPSIPMLVYAISVSGGAAVNVGDLFLAGAGPAVLIAGMLSVYSWFRSGGDASKRPTFDVAKLWQAMREGVWALGLPLLILGGIYSGLFTPTEASAVSIVYAVVVEMFIHREITWTQMAQAVVKSLVMMSALVLIIEASLGLQAYMVEKQAAQELLEWIQRQQLTPVAFLLAINVFLVVTGALMDSISAIVLFTPLIAPTAVALGIDPLHLGVVFIVNMEIGYVAPPIATNLFVSAQLFQRPFGQVVRAVMPTLGILCVGLMIVSYVPTLSTGIVYALKGGDFYQPFGGFNAAGQEPLPSPSDGSDGGTADDGPGRVLTLEEMMRISSEKNAVDGGS